MAPLRCVVVTPEKTVLEAEADFIALPLSDGETGISPGHAPMIGKMGYGELRLQFGGGTSRYYVDGGFVQVLDNVVSLLTQRAMSVDLINEAAAQEQLTAAIKKPTTTTELIEIRDRAIEQARAMIRVARKRNQ